jgi:hypothetical protein
MFIVQTYVKTIKNPWFPLDFFGKSLQVHGVVPGCFTTRRDLETSDWEATAVTGYTHNHRWDING